MALLGMLPTCFLGELLYLQMLLSPAWVLSFSYGLKLLQELQADRRKSHVLVSSVGSMHVNSRDKVDGEHISMN